MPRSRMLAILVRFSGARDRGAHNHRSSSYDDTFPGTNTKFAERFTAFAAKLKQPYGAALQLELSFFEAIAFHLTFRQNRPLGSVENLRLAAQLPSLTNRSLGEWHPPPPNSATSTVAYPIRCRLPCATVIATCKQPSLVQSTHLELRRWSTLPTASHPLC